MRHSWRYPARQLQADSSQILRCQLQIFRGRRSRCVSEHVADDLEGTPERSRLTARAWRKAWGPFLPWGLIPAARRRALVTQLRIDPFLNGRSGAWIPRNT